MKYLMSKKNFAIKKVIIHMQKRFDDAFDLKKIEESQAISNIE